MPISVLSRKPAEIRHHAHGHLVLSPRTPSCASLIRLLDDLPGRAEKDRESRSEAEQARQIKNRLAKAGDIAGDLAERGIHQCARWSEDRDLVADHLVHLAIDLDQAVVRGSRSTSGRRTSITPFSFEAYLHA